MKSSQAIKTFLFSLAAVAISAGTAYAGVEIGGGNDTTGPNSENHNSWEIEYEAEVDVNNTSSADNEVEISVDTGSNKIAKNTEIADITTGDIEGDISFENKLNDMAISFSDDDFADVSIDLANDTTGPESENHNRVEISYEKDLHINNHSEIDNNIAVSASSGGNTVKNNTTVGDLTTGDIEFISDVKNSANTSVSLDLDNPPSSGDVSVSLDNNKTGPNSSNVNRVEIEHESDIDLDNSASINNNYSATATTGDTNIKKNTVVGDISTGSIKIEYRATNTAN